MPLPTISVVEREAGICVEHPTQRGLLYQLESSGNLTSWEPAGPAHYGVGADFSAVVYVPPPPPDNPNPQPAWNAPARWISFYVTPITTTQTVVGFFSAGTFKRALLVGPNFLSPNFRMSVSIRQDEGTPANPSDDVVLYGDFLLFGWSRDLLLLPRSDENFPGMSAADKADLQRLIAARPALIAANQQAIANQPPAGPPPVPGPKRFYRLKVSELDTDADGIYDSLEFLAGTNPYANPALNPAGTNATASNPTGLTWKPFWKRKLPEVTLQQKWRSAALVIGEGDPSMGPAGIDLMTRGGAVQNYTMGTPRYNGLNNPVPDREQVRNNPRGQINMAWNSAPQILTAPSNANPEWVPWTTSYPVPIRSSYRCEQTPPVQDIVPNDKWRWVIAGEERILRLTCSTNAPEPLSRHFLHIKRARNWVGTAQPDWTYEPTKVFTLTIPDGSTESPPAYFTLPNHPEAETPAYYTAKTTEKEEIFLPIEILSPTRDRDTTAPAHTGTGIMLGKTAGVRALNYAPELRIAKLFPGKDTADAGYFPIAEASPHAIVPEEDPDSFMIRVHDTSEAWKQLSNPTAKPGIRVTTATPSPYDTTHSDNPANPALNQIDAASPAMAPGWLATKAMILVSNARDNEQSIYGATAGARNDPSRLALPGTTVTLAFPGWQRSSTPPAPDAITTLTLKVPTAATGTLDMKIFEDAFNANTLQHNNRFSNHLRVVNEHFAQTGMIFTKTPEISSIGLNATVPSSYMQDFYTSIPPPSPVTLQAKTLLSLAGRAVWTNFGWIEYSLRTDNYLGVLFCGPRPSGGATPLVGGFALTPWSLLPNEMAFAGNLYLNYDPTSGTHAGYDSQTTAHEVFHLLSNKGHYGDAESPRSYSSTASDFQKKLNLMTKGPWLPLSPNPSDPAPPQGTWPATHQRLSEEQEAMISKDGGLWLKNATSTP